MTKFDTNLMFALLNLIAAHVMNIPILSLAFSLFAVGYSIATIYRLFK